MQIHFTRRGAKKPLGVVSAVALLLIGIAISATPLQAQGDVKTKAQAVSSPESVSRDFLEILSSLSVLRFRKTDVYFHFPASGPVSQKSVKELGASLAWLMANMADQLAKPRFKTRLLQSNSQKARVKLERQPLAEPQDVVLIREAGGWRVDVVATYAVWNNISEPEAKKRILRLASTWASEAHADEGTIKAPRYHAYPPPMGK